MLFKGWVCEVFNGIWESRRHRLKEIIGEAAVPPSIDIMGDFRHIRHDFIHTGKATDKHCGKCKVLKWFKPQEPIVFKSDYVLDFLHQMAHMIYFSPWQAIHGYGWNLGWYIDPRDCDSSDVRLLSIRKSIDCEDKGGSTRHMLSCVFDDGIFGQGPINTGLTNEEFMQGEKNERGDVIFPRVEKTKERCSVLSLCEYTR